MESFGRGRKVLRGKEGKRKRRRKAAGGRVKRGRRRGGDGRES